MKVSIEWGMPSRWTFSIPPVNKFVSRWTEGQPIVVDPFAGNSAFATHSNDWGMGGKPAVEFLEELVNEGVQADVVIFDPPYSPRQISECYKGLGLKAAMEDTQNARLYANVRPLLSRICKPEGVALCFGWSSSGMGKKFGPVEELLLVQHGGAHNDTICVAQRKTS